MQVPATRISDVLAGRRQIQASEIAAVANYLEMTIPEVVRLAGGLDAAPKHQSLPLDEHVFVRGVVEAGLWIDSDEMEFPRDEWIPLEIPSDDRFPHGERFGLLVRGNSMNLIYPEGTILVCINPLRLGYEPGNGDHAIVRLRRQDGLVELTVKEIVEQEGHWWLWPRSSDPAHQQPIEVGTLNGAEEEAVTIMAVVVNAILPKSLKGRFSA